MLVSIKLSARKMEPHPGFEPGTGGLEIHSSSAELMRFSITSERS